MSDQPKPRIRLVIVNGVTYRKVRNDKGWRGPYGQTPCPARWMCIDCGRTVSGSDHTPEPYRDDICTNGHAPCRLCGKVLPRLMDGCPREHNWRHSPGKSKSDRMQPQHADVHHRTRRTPNPERTQP